MDKFAKVVGIGMQLVVAACAGYFVHRMVNDKAEELAQEGNALNAFAIGAGEAAVVASAATLAYHIAG